MAYSTWNKIDDSRRVAFQLKEETLTDINLLELKLQHPTEIITCDFTKHDEGRNGADWEWWFTNNREWKGFRVQAKVIDIHLDKFKHLHYQNPTSIPQSEKLIIQAECDKYYPLTPIYCFYLSTDKMDESAMYHPLKTYGCSLMNAYDVRTLRAGKICHVSELQEYLMPWHELVCHGSNETLLERVKYVAGSFFKNPKKLKSEFDGTLSSPPDYIRHLQRAIGDNVHFDYVPQSLAGVMIVTSEDI
ncbi:hypothetical protein GO816_16195 [Mucilaginibacter sp. HME9299]|uniref:Uncharacterized protein n=1 Tax=Mucilaginibacter aquatilis TaxID=1517760 RepID=A0A6I4IGB9_9SPHI|nr:hypothetical protein [Mucilaginibacter aquatilis]